MLRKKGLFPTFLQQLGISIFIFVVPAPEFVLDSEELLYSGEFKFLRTVFTHASVEFVFSKLLLVLQGHHRSRTCRPVIFHFLFLLPFSVVVFVLFRPSRGCSYNNLRNLKFGHQCNNNSSRNIGIMICLWIWRRPIRRKPVGLPPLKRGLNSIYLT